MQQAETLLIVGASARAAAQAAVRSGWRVAAVDLFADADLQAICRTWQVSPGDYPQGLIEAARQAPPGPWAYCGGLENHPDVISAISSQRELLGVDAKWLNRLRNPYGFAHQLQYWGFPSTTLMAQNAIPDAGRWLLKPKHSSGGRNIRQYGVPPYPVSDNQHYWSRWIDGVPQSAAYLFAGEEVRLLGVTEQLIGTPWTGGGGYLYCGNMGPLEISDDTLEQFVMLGECLAKVGLLRGLVGVDVVQDSAGRIHPLEINPRYTASMELFERAQGMPLIQWHIKACREGSLWNDSVDYRTDSLVQGKAILYARQSVQIERTFDQWCREQNGDRTWPVLADLPVVGTEVAAGHPLLTVFASGGCAEETRYALRQRAEQIYARIEQ